MQNFHEHKLWQDAFTALMEVHDVFAEVEATDVPREVVEDVLVSATEVASKIADALSRTDRRVARSLIYDSVGLVAVTRTHLAVTWGRGLVSDETFKNLDEKYAALSESLQKAG